MMGAMGWLGTEGLEDCVSEARRPAREKDSVQATKAAEELASRSQSIRSSEEAE